MATKKFEGQATLWEEPLGCQNATFYSGTSEVRESLKRPHAALVVFDGPSEPVFTASEVKKMLREVVDAYVGSPAMYTEFVHNGLPLFAAKHGITL